MKKIFERKKLSQSNRATENEKLDDNIEKCLEKSVRFFNF